MLHCFTGGNAFVLYGELNKSVFAQLNGFISLESPSCIFGSIALLFAFVLGYPLGPEIQNILALI
jgi:hypothetical protein